jgi:hypothetical protein
VVTGAEIDIKPSCPQMLKGKVGLGDSLSPRSDWRAPTDAAADVWLRELRDFMPDG